MGAVESATLGDGHPEGGLRNKGGVATGNPADDLTRFQTSGGQGGPRTLCTGKRTGDRGPIIPKGRSI